MTLLLLSSSLVHSEDDRNSSDIDIDDLEGAL